MVLLSELRTIKGTKTWHQIFGSKERTHTSTVSDLSSHFTKPASFHACYLPQNIMLADEHPVGTRNKQIQHTDDDQGNEVMTKRWI